MKPFTMIAGLAAGIAILPALSGAATAQTVGFATLPPGAINNITVNVIAKVVQKQSGLKLRVIPMRGTKAILTAVQNGTAAFGISDVANLTAAFRGEDQFQGKPLKNLRIAFKVRALTVGMFVRKDSAIKSVADIKGKKYPSQWSAFPNAIPLSLGIMATEGLTFDDINGVPVTNIIRGADDFKAGKTDIGFFAIGAPKMAEVNSAVGGIRWLSIDNTPAKLAKMRAIRPDYYIHTVKPSPINAGITGPTNVLGVDLGILVGAKVADDVVEKMVATVAANKPELIKGHPLFRGFFPKTMSKQFKYARYHPGAVKFYKSKNMWPKG